MTSVSKRRRVDASSTVSSSSSSSSSVAASSSSSSVADLERLISPLSSAEFFADYWEKKPLHLSGPRRVPLDLGTTLASCIAACRDRALVYGKHLNVCRVAGGERVDMNGDGQVDADALALQFHEESGTIQWFQPQQHARPLWGVMSQLEDQFGCLCGASAYITPPGAQGLMPHYDDVEVFVVQVEGRKKWSVHAPPPGEVLPREHSADLDPATIGEPLLEVELAPGDLLYMPRGFVHFATTTALKEHSTHVTISTYQKFAFVDFMTAALPRVLSAVAEGDVDLRRGLPVGVLDFMGRGVEAAADVDADGDGTAGDECGEGGAEGTEGKGGDGASSSRAEAFAGTFSGLLRRVADAVDTGDLHDTMDEISFDFVCNRLPPCPPHGEASGDESESESESEDGFEGEEIRAGGEEDGDEDAAADDAGVAALPSADGVERKGGDDEGKEGGKGEGTGEGEGEAEAEDGGEGGGGDNALDDGEDASDEGEDDMMPKVEELARRAKEAGLTATSRIRLRNPRWVRMMLITDDNDDCWATLYHSLGNSRRKHLHCDNRENPRGLVRFPADHAAAISCLITSGLKGAATSGASGSSGTAVAELPMLVEVSISHVCTCAV